MGDRFYSDPHMDETDPPVFETISNTIKQLEYQKKTYLNRGPAFWTLQKEKQLAAMWQGQPHLYNNEAYNYRHARLRRETYEHFGTILGCDGNFFLNAYCISLYLITYYMNISCKHTVFFINIKYLFRNVLVYLCMCVFLFFFFFWWGLWTHIKNTG